MRHRTHSRHRTSAPSAAPSTGTALLDRPEPDDPPVKARPARWARSPRARIPQRLVVAAIVLVAICATSVAVAYPHRGPGKGGGAGAEVSLFGSTVPKTATDPDTRPVELGMRFRATQAGAVTGVRFYQGPRNTGSHIGRLWDTAGHVLAQATFATSAAAGWQQVRFATPISLVPGAEYVVSYFAPNGGYAADKGYFERGDRASGPLVALADTKAKPNGLFRYGAQGGFPTRTWWSANYYVDVLFRTGSVPGAEPPANPPVQQTSAAPAPPSAKPLPPPPPASIPSISPTPPVSSTSSSAPATQPAPPGGGATLPGWPSASNTGNHKAGLRRLGGDQLVDAGWLRTNGAGGSGTSADPYKIDGLLIAGMLHVQIGTGNYLTISNTRVYGGDFAGLWLDSGHVTMTDSTLAPESGGRSTIGVLANYNGTFLRNDISGFNIGIMVQGDGPYLIQDNYLHDTFFADGDHTDVINMNPHASNGVVKHNWIDGGRMDGQFTHNGIGLYNDATPGQGTAPSRNWTIDGNYITRSNYLIYAAATPPFVIKNNVLTTKFQYGAFYNALSGATDGGGNVTETGKAVRISD
ncbi:MAG: hypothetical protein V7637_5916 [Mycobacteriales bacterium]